MSLLPIAVPFLLIAAAACSQAWGNGQAWSAIIETVGEKNVAVGIGTFVAIGLLRWSQRRDQVPDILAKAVSGAGGIILITAAGGAFGAVLGQAGIAERMSLNGVSSSGLLLLTMAFLLTVAIRTLQGSATVAMITAAGILQGVVTLESLPFHPVYLVLAIGGGSKPIAWMNDSGFWVMCKMSGMSEAEGLRTVSPLTIAMGVSTLFWTLLAAWLLPFKIAM
jgi:GntP family gluconate:H+ symporter